MSIKRALANQSKTIRLPVHAGDVLASGADFYSDPMLSPDGRRLASAGKDGSVRVWDLAAEIARLAAAAKDGKAKREELMGSTITLTSLGTLGARLDKLVEDVTAAMRVVGARFSRNEVYVPEMLVAPE